MCGVAGIIDYRGQKISSSLVEKMLRSINYRGPDESGVYISPVAALGNVRLSIVDLAGGQQPLSDPSGRYWIVFNGEIFNYPELRQDLRSKGCSFNTQSDTEVLVQLYATYGKKCLSMVNGQFAFAIWDKMEEELFIARDRIGIRPLFYNLTDGVLSFASEIKALLVQDHIKRELSHKNLSQVFTFWTTITPNTVFEDIFELSPGHCMTFSRKGLKIEKFWDLSFGKRQSNSSLDQVIGELNELFSDAVRIRLRADVEVAAYLSGGIDSSTTVAYIKEIEPGILNTFSIGFEEKDFDESSYQNEAVSFLKTKHKSIRCSPEDISESFPRVVWHTEIPLTRTAPAPMFLLSKLVRDNNIKVVITGEGADEMLAGYDIFKEAKIRRFWASQPDSALRPRLLTKLYPYLPQMKQANPAILRMFYGYKLQETDNPYYSHLLRWNNSNHIKKHFSEQIKSEINGYSPFESLERQIPPDFGKLDYLEKAQWLETTVFMSGYLLSSQGDRMAMANSVEGRYPFLDYRVIEFCNSLPGDLKLNGLNEKYLLKKMMKDRIPESIIKRSKQAYRAPIKSAFFLEKRPAYVDEMVSPDFFRKAGIFNYESVSALFAKIKQTGKTSEIEDMIISSVISAHLLHKLFIENDSFVSVDQKLNNHKTIRESK
jgi:asparagine synthase (glutamine-hydrolysing)